MSVIGTFTGALGDVAHASPVGGLAQSATKAVAGFALSNIAAWVLTGTEDALRQVASAIGATTSPNLQSTWFSSTYWRVAALAALLTVPFISAAALQALARSDLALLAKSVFGYLPLSLIGVSLAAPLTMLLLAATDQMSSAVSATGIRGGAQFLDQAAGVAGSLSAADGSLFFAVIIGLFAILASLALAVELLVREAAVYVVVLMLPLAFAAMVWPARRVWAIRLVELLVSLILSKFVIVAVLSLAGAALASGANQLSTLLTAMALVMFATFAPWALMRILPFTELAAGTAGMMRHELPRVGDSAQRLWGHSGSGAELAMGLPERLRRQAEEVAGGSAGQGSAPAGSGGFAFATSNSRTPDATSAEPQPPPGREPSTGPQPPLGREPSTAPEPSTGPEPSAAPQASAGGSGPANGTGTSTQPAPAGDAQVDRRSETGTAASESPATPPVSAESPDEDPRGPLRLPKMWDTADLPWDEQPELILGPELVTGPFDGATTRDTAADDGEPE